MAVKRFGPWLFAGFALVHAAIAVLALSLVQQWLLVALPLAAVELVTAYDNAIVAAGQRIGLGPRAVGLNRARFLLHAVVIGLLIFVYVGIGARLQVPMLASDWSTAGAAVLAGAIALLGYAVQFRKLGPLMPSNYFGCLRYVQAVDAARHYPGYRYSAAELAQRPVPPLASIVTVLIGLCIALSIGWSAGFWLPFAVTALMFSAAALPPRSWGPLTTSVLEIVFSAGLLWSVFQLVGQPN